MSRRPGDLIVKDPDATGDPQGFDWTAWLLELGASVTISTSTWSVSPDDAAVADRLALSSASIVTGSLRTQVKLSAGTLGVRYTVTNRVTTSAGNVDERSFKVLVEQR